MSHGCTYNVRRTGSAGPKSDRREAANSGSSDVLAHNTGYGRVPIDKTDTTDLAPSGRCAADATLVADEMFPAHVTVPDIRPLATVRSRSEEAGVLHLHDIELPASSPRRVALSLAKLGLVR